MVGQNFNICVRLRMGGHGIGVRIGGYVKYIYVHGGCIIVESPPYAPPPPLPLLGDSIVPYLPCSHMASSASHTPFVSSLHLPTPPHIALTSPFAAPSMAHSIYGTISLSFASLAENEQICTRTYVGGCTCA